MIIHGNDIWWKKGHLPLAPTISCEAYPSLVSTALIMSAYGMVDGRIA